MLLIATADCERGFSAMNRIKIVLRNRLKTNTLEQLMFISIEGLSPDKFDFGRAADKWVDCTIIEFIGKTKLLSLVQCHY